MLNTIVFIAKCVLQGNSMSKAYTSLRVNEICWHSHNMP